MSEDVVSSATDRTGSGTSSAEGEGDYLAEARRLLGCFTEAQVRELGQHLNLPHWQVDAIIGDVFAPAEPPEP